MLTGIIKELNRERIREAILPQVANTLLAVANDYILEILIIPGNYYLKMEHPENKDYPEKKVKTGYSTLPG